MDRKPVMCLRRDRRQEVAAEIQAEIPVPRYRQSGLGNPRQGQHVRVVAPHLPDVKVGFTLLERLPPVPPGVTRQTQLLEQNRCPPAQLVGASASRRVRKLAMTPAQPVQKLLPGGLVQFAEAVGVNDDGPAHGEAVYGSSNPRYFMVSSMKNLR